MCPSPAPERSCKTVRNPRAQAQQKWRIQARRKTPGTGVFHPPSVGVDHDTARFAAEALHRWWQEMGSLAYPEATRLLITADSGGSNSRRSRLWKVSVQD